MVELCALPDVLAKKAAAELNEDPENNDYYLNALRDWVRTQPHLNCRTTDKFLIAFLRGAKFSLEKAKQKLENYYIYRAWMPEIFLDRDVYDPKVDMIIKSGCLIHLPTPIEPDGPRVVMIRARGFDMKKHTIPDVFKVGTMATDILLLEDVNAIISGYIIILDLANMPKSVIMNFDPTFVRKMTIMANKMSPTRMKGFHILSVPPIFEKLFNMVKSVINVKLRERFYVHGSEFESLYKHIPQHILPKEYGGDWDLDQLQEGLLQKIRDHKEFLKEEESFGVKEEYSKNCRSQAAKEDLFGMQGSFRQLNVD